MAKSDQRRPASSASRQGRSQVETTESRIRIAYQSRGIGAAEAEQGHGRSDLLGRGSVGPQAVDGGSARDGELLGGGTQASAGESGRKHGDDGICQKGPRKERRIKESSERRSEGMQWPVVSSGGVGDEERRPTSPDSGHVRFRTRRVGWFTACPMR